MAVKNALIIYSCIFFLSCAGEKKPQNILVNEKKKEIVLAENSEKKENGNERKSLLSPSELEWLELSNKKISALKADLCVLSDTSKYIVQSGKFCKILTKNNEFIRFRVDDVETAEKPFFEKDYLRVLEQRAGKELFLMQNTRKGDKIVPSDGNVFANTIYNAYRSHRPLELSPDVIWLAVMQGVALHLNQKPNYLSLVLKDTTSKKIIVRNDSLVNLNSRDWENLMQSFCDSVGKNIRSELKDTFTPKFTTTQDFHTAAYNITLMNAVKSKYVFIGESGCGIPYITLKGRPEDWKKILQEIDKLNGIGLGFWVKELKPVLEQFYLSSTGQANEFFWQGMVKEGQPYGSCISGWFIKFFPYLEGLGQEVANFSENSAYEKKFKKEYYINPYIRGFDYLTACYDFNDLPESIVDVPVTWKNYFKIPNETKNLQFHAGFVGMRQNKKNKEITPETAWFITETTGKIIKSKDDFYEIEERDTSYHNLYEGKVLVEQENFKNSSWYFQIKGLPIYNSTVNESFNAGMNELKSKICAELLKNKFNTVSPILLEFNVESIGLITNFIVKSNNKDVRLSKTIKQFLKNDKTKWQAAYIENGLSNKHFLPFRLQVLILPEDLL